ncbi:FAD-dependent oxidoreductase [uncultured Litoreibacter sp.]|uniref:FAD-dependent oxidoreductase n=1 Tax=uncultured Litoreibacter sp. TaxID=1392394 RepID=UPI002627E7A4|nr:FAD-dependent oxidoreductase [uncultured Litoreibacter sp.]
MKTEIIDRIAWVTIDNPPVNATSTAVRSELLQAINDIQGCKLAVLQCAGKTFVAGGDMSEFDAPPAAPHLPDVVNAIENSPVPFLAILHGSVLGGGLEIAMACAYRIAKPGTKFGLPEVNVGLIPGAGGTQRAPRLLGWEAAVKMACLGQLASAQELLELGAIDAVSDDPRSQVATFIDRPFVPVSTRDVPPSQIMDTLGETVRRSAKGRIAPLHNFTALQWAAAPYKTSQPKERTLHLALRQSDESKALRHIFFAERASSRPEALRGTTPQPVASVAIVGGGLMGCGIASACLNAGHSVHIVERDVEAAAKATDTVRGLLQGALERGKISEEQFQGRLKAFHASDIYADIAHVDLAIEAVFEDLAAKQDVFNELSRVMRPDALLATNTSYLDPNDIFAGVPNPERCLGLHFFSPAHIMKLVEVIRTQSTGMSALASGFAFAKGLRKTPVLAGVCDGFIGNRILAAYRRAAEYLLADGALPYEVDAAMRAFGMAMGPFEAQDQSGLQIAEANRRRQDVNRDPNERYVTISDRLCAKGRLGRRSGMGWYSYSAGSKAPQCDPQVEEIIFDYRAKTGLSQTKFTAEDIQTQLLTAMANEGARIVEEGIADSAADVDVVKTSGYGFPRWRGGPMHWATMVGPDALIATLNTMDQASPGSWIRASKYSNTSFDQR